MSDMLDRLAARVGIWALRRLFGTCATDVRDDFPDEPTLVCPGCDASRLVKAMQEILDEPVQRKSGWSVVG